MNPILGRRLKLRWVLTSFAVACAACTWANAASVSVAPAAASLLPGQTLKFSADISGALLPVVTWSLSPALGTISSSGLYQAPASIAAAGTVEVIATLKYNPKVSSHSQVSLVPPPPVPTPVFSLFAPSTGGVPPETGYANSQVVDVAVLNASTATAWCLSDFATPVPASPSPCAQGNWVSVPPTSYTLGNFDGTHGVYLWSRDAYGDISAVPGTQSIILDRTPPVAQLLDLSGGQTLSDGVAQFITWIASDANLGTISLEYSADSGQSWQLIVTLATNSGIYPWNAPSLAGQHVLIRVTATDLAGNVGTSTSALAVSSGAMSVDCSLAGGLCPAMSIAGDAPQSGTFHGFADPSMRRDPVTGMLWMAYSWPNTHTNGSVNTQTVDIHLSSSVDGGKTWTYAGPLWQSALTTNTTVSPPRQDYSSHEVANILPVTQNGATMWYAVHETYLVQPGTFIYSEESTTGTTVISAAASPAELADPALPTQALGTALTKVAMDVDLERLSPALNACVGFNEPALFAQNGMLYLLLQCLTPDRAGGFYAVLTAPLATNPQDLQWQYVGQFGGPSDAALLGGSYLVELDLAQRADGSLVVIVTPATETTSFGKQTDAHLGCKAVDFSLGDAANPAPHFVTGPDGALSVRASVTENDIMTAPNLGPGACTYEPTSSTGIVIVRKLIANLSEGYFWSLQSTGLMP